MLDNPQGVEPGRAHCLARTAGRVAQDKKEGQSSPLVALITRDTVHGGDQIAVASCIATCVGTD